MQKKILLIAVCVTLTSVCVQAQNKKHFPPPSPPPAPQAPIAPVAPTLEAITAPLPPPPPVPPVPPVPPIAPVMEELIAPVIINNNGYEVSLGNIKGQTIVFLEKDGKDQMIRLSTWNANKKYYEKKYGQLPLLFTVTEKI